MEYLFAILCFLFFFGLIFLLKFFKKSGFKTYILAILFSLKLIGGLSLYLIYTYYYDSETSDIHKYYRGGCVLHSATKQSYADYFRLVSGVQGKNENLQKYYDQTEHWTRPYSYGLFNDSRTVMRFNALLCLVSKGNIYIHLIVMAFMSFLGAFALFKAIEKLTGLNKYLNLIASFLIPSCLFWTSGLLKEGLVMFALGFAIYYMVKIYFKFKISDFLLFLLFLFLIGISKIYVLPALLPMIILFFVGKKFKDKGKILSLIFISLICFLAVVFSDKVFSYDVLSAVAGKQNDFISSSQLGEGVGSNFELTRLEPNLKSFMKIIPEGLANSFFRPFFNEINSVFLLLAFLEVLFLVFTFIISIVFFKKPEANKLLFVLFSLGFVIYLFVLIGVITPNSGAIVRYRSIGLPFLYAMLFCFWDLKRIKKLLLKS
jgi:hypothetical protein